MVTERGVADARGMDITFDLSGNISSPALRVARLNLLRLAISSSASVSR
jgi:hypothetical protein